MGSYNYVTEMETEGLQGISVPEPVAAPKVSSGLETKEPVVIIMI